MLKTLLRTRPPIASSWRTFASMTTNKPLRIGYVPEHYLIPLHLAQPKFSTPVELIPFPSGTGHMITSLRSDEIDLAIGLTEGWVAGLMSVQGLKEKGYSIVGSWVQNPLRWAIVTGRNRDDISSVADLKQHRRACVSRIGSGSYVMAHVLAEQEGWLQEKRENKSGKGLTTVPLGPFKDLRDGVTGKDGQDPAADFFMWEHFTTKPYFDGDKTPLKHVGEIYTPWPSWQIAASTKTFPEPASDSTLSEVFETLDAGVHEFNKDTGSAIKRLVKGEFHCQYSEEDANEWLGPVKFFSQTRGVDRATVENVVDVLKTAGVIESSTKLEDSGGVIGIARD